MKLIKKMAKAIGDCSFYRRLFENGSIGRLETITELQIVHAYNYEILLPYSVLYCVVGTSFKRNHNNPETYNTFVKKYGLKLVECEQMWARNIDRLFQRNYGQIATPTLADMEVRSLIKRDMDIEFLLTYEKLKYADLFHQIQTF